MFGTEIEDDHDYQAIEGSPDRKNCRTVFGCGSTLELPLNAFARLSISPLFPNPLNKLWVIQRVVSAAYMCAALTWVAVEYFIRFDASHFFEFYVHWALIIATVYFILVATMTWKMYRENRELNGTIIPQFSHAISHCRLWNTLATLLLHTSFIANWAVALSYWVASPQPHVDEDPLLLATIVQKYAIVPIVITADLLVGAISMRYIDILLGVLFGIIHAIFQIIWVYSGGHRIYTEIDWKDSFGSSTVAWLKVLLAGVIIGIPLVVIRRMIDVWWGNPNIEKWRENYKQCAGVIAHMPAYSHGYSSERDPIIS